MMTRTPLVETPATTDPETKEEQRRLQIEKNRPLIELLRSWRDADEEERQEQRETWEFLKKALDEDRLSYRKHFP